MQYRRYIFLLFIFPQILFASTLSGGNFVVNGGFTAIDGSASGGNFIVSSSFAPIVGPSTSPATTGGSSSGYYPNFIQNNINVGSSFVPAQNNPIKKPFVSSKLEKIFNSTNNSCDKYIVVTKPISIGLENDVYRVKKIETFLNTYEKTNLPVDGFYSIDDKNAVEEFQNKYASEILAPWGYVHATGTVYITTVAKMNNIFCAHTGNFEISNTHPSFSEKIQILEQKAEQLFDRAVNKMKHLTLWERIKNFFNINIFHR